MIESYFANRKFCVKINETISKTKNLVCGVPQGSLLGPLFYVLYTKGIEKIVEDHGLRVQCYADDCQVYISFEENEVNQTETKLVECLTDITKWMSSNFLKINKEKTKIKIFKHKLSVMPELNHLGKNARNQSSF